jgi:hypothetical protein
VFSALTPTFIADVTPPTPSVVGGRGMRTSGFCCADDGTVEVGSTDAAVGRRRRAVAHPLFLSVPFSAPASDVNNVVGDLSPHRVALSHEVEPGQE